MSTSSAKHIFAILRLIGRETRPIGATEVSRRLGLPMTTAHRALNTLEQSGYIARHQSSTKYVIGLTSQLVVQSFLSRFPVRSLALPYMQRLSVISGDTTSLFVRIGWYVVRIASVKGTNEVIHTGPIAECLPLDHNAAGRVVLRWLTPDLQARYEASSQAKRHDTPDAFGFTRGESCPSWLAGWNETSRQSQLAFPILGADRTPLGALAIEGGSKLELGEEEEEQLLSYLQVIEQLSQALRTAGRATENPYAHLDPDTIELPAGRPQAYMGQEMQTEPAAARAEDAL